MARLRDLKVGMTIKIKKGKTPAPSFGLPEQDVNKFIGKTTKIKSIDSITTGLLKVQTSSETESFWFPPDWIEIVKEPVAETLNQPTTIPQPEKEIKMTKKQYILGYKDAFSEIFDDIDSLPKVANDYFDLYINELNEEFEVGTLRLLEVEVVPVEIKVNVEYA